MYTVRYHIYRFMPPSLWQKGRDTVSPYSRDLNAFVDACTMLLSDDITAANLTVKEHQVLQFYLAAMIAKFPALLK